MGHWKAGVVRRWKHPWKVWWVDGVVGHPWMRCWERGRKVSMGGAASPLVVGGWKVCMCGVA